MTEYTWVIVVLFWAIACGLLLWGWYGWKQLDEPHTYDDRIMQRDLDIAVAEAEEELKLRPHVRAGKK